MSAGIFVTFEGPEGCGKSTQIKLLHSWLNENGCDVIMTREPGGTSIGEQIRALLKSIENFTTICPLAELMLFEACRAQHMHEKVLPALKEGKIVLCDRFIDSSTVYQGIARKIGQDNVEKINELAITKHIPNVTFILDVPVDVTVERIKARGGAVDRIEKEGEAFFQVVRDGYLNLAKTNKRFLVIDGRRPVESIAQQIRNEFRTRFL